VNSSIICFVISTSKSEELPVLRWLVLLMCAALLAGCGGGGSTSNPNPPPGGGGPVSAPVVVTVGAGATAAGVDISVVAAAGTKPNVEVLGVAPVGPGGTATNTGGTIQRGTTMKVLLFGAGLTGSLEVIVSGPQDFTISNVRNITATDNTPGVAFDLSMNGNAALGARTVLLKASDNDITAFTGGLEVVP
jgi:hypothetical protein